MNRLIPIACLALIGAAASQAYAQQAEGAAPVVTESTKDGTVKAAPAAAGKPQQVTVNGSRAASRAPTTGSNSRPARPPTSASITA